MAATRVQKFVYEPKGTVGVSIEVLVSFGCDDAPEVKAVQIVGLNQVGFLISSQYEVEAFVDGSKPGKCVLSDCDNSTEFVFHVNYYVYLVVGIGFGLGWGTGTAGWKSKSQLEREKWKTRCICCDKPQARESAVASINGAHLPRRSYAALSTSLLVTGGLVLSSAYLFDSPDFGTIAKSVLGALAICVAYPLVSALRRKRAFRRFPKAENCEESPSAHDDPVSAD